MPTDLEIAQSVTMQPITEVAQKMGIPADDLELYGKYKANITIDKSKDCEDTDFGIYTNKDGNYAWRKLQIINPIL